MSNKKQNRRNKKDNNHEGLSFPEALRPKLSARLRGYFFAGVLVTAPLTITIWLAWQLIQYIDQAVVPLIPAKLNPATYLDHWLGMNISVPGLGLVVLVAVITLIGAVTAGLVGKLMIRLGERAMEATPFIRSVYKVIKQLLETVLTDQSKAFRKAVMIEYPRRECWTMGFVTADPADKKLAKTVGQDLIAVFVPTTPNPTSGFLLFVPRHDVKELELPVEDAFKLLISVGIVSNQDNKENNKDDR